MRAHPAIAVVTIILVGFGLKLTFFSGPIAAADVGSAKSARIDISEMHQNIKNLPVEKIHDMTFVFSRVVDRTISPRCERAHHLFQKTMQIA